MRIDKKIRLIQTPAEELDFRFMRVEDSITRKNCIEDSTLSDDEFLLFSPYISEMSAIIYEMYFATYDFQLYIYVQKDLAQFELDCTTFSRSIHRYLSELARRLENIIVAIEPLSEDYVYIRLSKKSSYVPNPQLN